MSISNSPQSEYTSAYLEKVVLERFRSLLGFLPTQCKIYREVWGQTTALCLDFQACREQIKQILPQTVVIIETSHDLALANAIVFRCGHKILGWKTIQV
jgi:hypothetical protein